MNILKLKNFEVFKDIHLYKIKSINIKIKGMKKRNGRDKTNRKRLKWEGDNFILKNLKRERGRENIENKEKSILFTFSYIAIDLIIYLNERKYLFFVKFRIIEILKKKNK